MHIESLFHEERRVIAAMAYPNETRPFHLPNLLKFDTELVNLNGSIVAVLDENGAVKARMTDNDWRAFQMRLRDLANQDYRAYQYEQYEQQVARFTPHPFVTVDTANLVKALTEAKAAFKAGTPNAYALRLELGKRKSENELMVTLPGELAGYAIEVSYEYLLDLLYVFKRCKVKTLKLRIEPLANGVSSDKRSVLKLVDGKDVYSLYSGTALDLTPLPEPTPDFTLYESEAMPGGDAAPFPMAHVKPVNDAVPTVHEIDTPFGLMTVTPAQPETVYRGVKQWVAVEGKDLIKIHGITYHIAGSFDRTVDDKGVIIEWHGYVGLSRTETCEVTNWNPKGWCIARNVYPTDKARRHIRGLDDLIKTWLADHAAEMEVGQIQAQHKLIAAGRERLGRAAKAVEERRCEIDAMEQRLAKTGLLTPREVEILNPSGNHWRF